MRRRLHDLACLFLLLCGLAACSTQTKIDRHALVSRHNPQLTNIDWRSPFTLGNGQFAFTVDVTGLQSLADDYYNNGTPLETKARWAWHSTDNPQHFHLANTHQDYAAYGRQVAFPTNSDTDAGQWLRKNPHDLPLARIAMQYKGSAIKATQLKQIEQRLNLWHGKLNSQFVLDNVPVKVVTSVAQQSDTLGFDIQSNLLAKQQLAVLLAFPRGYDMQVKNTPNLVWTANEHQTELIQLGAQSALFQRQIDDHMHWLKVNWQGKAKLIKQDEHHYLLEPETQTQNLQVSLQFSQVKEDILGQVTFEQVKNEAQLTWPQFWATGAAIDFSGSQAPQAMELERRIILSQYLMAVQERAAIPAQETGLTSSSWYGKFHTEMSWWHSAHWVLWGRAQYTEKYLDWYVQHLSQAQSTAAKRGLQGARWSKMIGPDGRESPGGNPLIIWNQAQPIDLAERVFQRRNDKQVLLRYSELVQQTAEALSSMLVYEPLKQRYSLLPPIWIAQEHYEVTQSYNPSFELAYWRTALITAQAWRQRLGKQPDALWQKQIQQLAALPQKDAKYVAIESIPDTFDNIDSRNDHPAMLGAWGLLQDERVELNIMQNTLNAVMQDWDFATRIWGWDYPMIAMTANKLGQAQTAVDALLMDALNNHYMVNGHCPQQKVGLPVYLPANGALLSAIAMMAVTHPESASKGFPADGLWQLKTEGF